MERYRKRIRELEDQVAELGQRIAQLEAELQRLRAGAERGGAAQQPPAGSEGTSEPPAPVGDCESELERLRRTVEELSAEVERLSGFSPSEVERRLLEYLHRTGGWFDLDEASEELNLPRETVMAAARSLASKGALILVEGGA